MTDHCTDAQPSHIAYSDDGFQAAQNITLISQIMAVPKENQTFQSRILAYTQETA